MHTIALRLDAVCNASIGGCHSGRSSHIATFDATVMELTLFLEQGLFIPAPAFLQNRSRISYKRPAQRATSLCLGRGDIQGDVRAKTLDG